MIGQFAFLVDKRRATTIAAVAMSLCVLLLLPASLGLGSGGATIIMQEAFGQFNLPTLEEEEAEEVGAIDCRDFASKDSNSLLEGSQRAP